MVDKKEIEVTPRDLTYMTKLFENMRELAQVLATDNEMTAARQFQLDGAEKLFESECDRGGERIYDPSRD